MEIKISSVIDQATFNISSISAIGVDNRCIDETLASTMSSTGISASLMGHRSTKKNYINVVDRLCLMQAKNAGPFLDGCNVSLKYNVFYIKYLF